MSRLLDLSHTVSHGTVTYEGLPAPIICDYWSRQASSEHYDQGVSFQIGKIEMVANTGTYIDAPFHRYKEGKDIAQLTLASLAHLDSVCVRIDEIGEPIVPKFFDGVELTGKAVLIETGWDRYWGKEQYFSGHPFLTAETAELLRDSKVALVGIDSYNIDDTDDLKRPVHSILLGAEIPIIEHMTNLGDLPNTGFAFTAVPPKISGMGSFPVRAFATIE